MSKHVYSATSDEESIDENHVEMVLNVSEWKIWKVGVEQQLRDLNERVNTLELHKNGSYPKLQTENIISFATAEDDGLCGLYTCARVIRWEKSALLQCIWLIFFIAALAAIGANQFLRAKWNTEAEFKPERKLKTINYQGTKGEQFIYETPYIYLYFIIGDFRNWTNETSQARGAQISDTLENLLMSQNYFSDSVYITYVSNELGSWRLALPIEEAKAFHWGPSDSQWLFMGYFRLKAANPYAYDGYFTYEVNINMKALTLGQTVFVNGLWLSIGRELAFANWGELLFVNTEAVVNKNSSIYAIVDYQEKVTRKISNEYVHSFFSSLEWIEINELEREAGWVTFELRPDLMIEHWVEYVDYDYYDWCAWMGGIISIASILFFKGAYFLAVSFGERNSMGILPKMSLIFRTYETVHLLKERVQNV